MHAMRTTIFLNEKGLTSSGKWLVNGLGYLLIHGVYLGYFTNFFPNFGSIHFRHGKLPPKTMGFVARVSPSALPRRPWPRPPPGRNPTERPLRHTAPGEFFAQFRFPPDSAVEGRGERSEHLGEGGVCH